MPQKLYVFCSIKGEGIELFFRNALHFEYDTFYDTSSVEGCHLFIDHRKSAIQAEKLWLGSNGNLYVLLSYEDLQSPYSLEELYAQQKFDKFLVNYLNEKLSADINWVYPIYLNINRQEENEAMSLAWGTITFSWSVMHIENTKKNPVEDKEFLESIFNTFSNYDLALVVNNIVSKYLIEITQLNSYKYIENIIRIVNIYLYSIDLKSKLVNYEYQSFENKLIKMCSIDNYYSTLKGYNEILIANLKNSNLQKDEAFKNNITILGIIVSASSFLRIDVLSDVLIKYLTSYKILSIGQEILNLRFIYALMIVISIAYYLIQRQKYQSIKTHNEQLTLLIKRKNEIR